MKTSFGGPTPGPAFFSLMRVAAISLSLVLMFASPVSAHHGEVVKRAGRERHELVSVSTAGEHANGPSGHYSCGGSGVGGDFRAPALSHGGRFIAFSSAAANLHPDDTNGSRFTDVFVRDRRTGRTELISLFLGQLPALPSDLSGQGCMEMSFHPAISSTGRHVAFASRLPLTGADDVDTTSPLGWKVFIHDRQTGKTRLISTRNDDGRQGAMAGNSGVMTVSISDNGRYVAFDNTPSPGDPSQIYVHDRRTGNLRIVSVSSAGEVADVSTYKGSISGSGGHVVFESTATNLAANDQNTGSDVFVHDIGSRKTELISVGVGGTSSNGNAWLQCCDGRRVAGQVITSNGRFVVFDSTARDITPTGKPGFDYGLFIRDRVRQRTERVSVSSTGTIFNAPSNGQITDDGRYVSWTGSSTPGGFTPCGGHPHPLTGGCPHILDGHFLYDRDNGELSYVARDTQTNIPLVMDPARGRFHAFATKEGLADRDADRGESDLAEWDVYVRDLQLVGRGAAEVATPVSIEGEGKGGRSGMVRRRDPKDDTAVPHTADIVSTQLAHRERSSDLFVAIDVERLDPQPTLTLSSSAIYGLRFDTGGKTYEARATSLLGGTFSLFECRTPTVGCAHVADLRGGFGTTGERVIFSLPLDVVGLDDGGHIRNVEAFSALGESIFGVAAVLDTSPLR